MELTKELLTEVFTLEEISKSTYTTPRGAIHIRLINNKSDKALVPALYPNLPTYRKALNKYSNIKRNRQEGANGNWTGNRAMDADVTPTELIPKTED